MFEDLHRKIINYITSRITVMTVLFILLGFALIHRCFQLQIVNGASYLEEFILMAEKSRDIASTRGNIYDRNGEVLAFNELAYSVKIEDVFEKGKNRNKKINETISRLIHTVEKNGDHVSGDFKIILNDDGEFEYTVSGTALLRFLADVYGHTKTEQLKPEEKESAPRDVMEFLSGPKKFAVGDYLTPGDTSSEFICGKDYSREEWLKVVTLRYAMDLTSFRKYIGTTVATNVCRETVAAVMENSEDLPGVTIEEDTIRRYVDSVYFSHVLGYTGKISSDELAELNARAEEENGGNPGTYGLNDVVGKSGIENYMETTLQGSKGSETVIVDNVGKVIKILERKEATSGDDVYLSIDKKLTEVVYNILEQHLAGLIASKIANIKEYIPKENSSSSDILIPIYDVYFALINNSVIDVKHFTSPRAGETEKDVYEKFLAYRDQVYVKLREELMEDKTPYNRLSKEFQVYQSNIVSLLNKNGIIMSDLVDAKDPMYKAWTVDETISLQEYLMYLITQNWIDGSQLELTQEYSDSSEEYEKLVDYIIDIVDKNTEFQKRFYKYMLLGDIITGKQICMILCEQRKVDISLKDEDELYSGKLSPYQFVMNRIQNIDITPAQLALDPCNGSVVITDVNTGEVLAMVSYPGYDNNKLANSIDADYYAKLNADKAYPWNNYATQYKAAPGSTFKMVVATAGLMENAIGLGTSISCMGTYTNVTPSPKCWNVWGHGRENVTTAIRDSCNYFFYDVGYRLSMKNGVYNVDTGLNTLFQYADFYGLTEKSGVEIAEAVPDVSDIDPVRSAIGQGGNSFTTVGLARYVSAVANSGTVYNLTLLKQVADQSGNIKKTFTPNIRNTIQMPQQNWDAIHKGMRLVVQGKRYFNDLEVEIAGKTGTAQQSNSRPSHALFVCYAPYEQPEISIATRIPFGYSSDYAAQVTKDVIKYYYGLADEEDLVTGTADTPDGGVSNEM